MKDCERNSKLVTKKVIINHDKQVKFIIEITISTL